MGDVLDLIGVSVVRNETTLLDEVTWTVREGERWVLLGPNGAGKTTLLQIAGARLHPTKGTTRILDETLGSVDVFDLRPRIGLSSAAFAETLPSHERVADVVLTAAYAVAGRWRESYDPLDHRRSDDLLSAFGVAHLADRTFGTLSEGERKRVQLARSLMTDPELVLLDEPAAGLDLGGRETLVQDLSELASDKRSPVLILVTHHVEEIPPGFTHGLLLRGGRIVAAGPLESVLTDDNLTATFDVPLAISRTNGRWAARIRLEGEPAQAPPRPREDALGVIPDDLPDVTTSLEPPQPDLPEPVGPEGPVEDGDPAPPAAGAAEDAEGGHDEQPAPDPGHPAPEAPVSPARPAPFRAFDFGAELDPRPAYDAPPPSAPPAGETPRHEGEPGFGGPAFPDHGQGFGPGPARQEPAGEGTDEGAPHVPGIERPGYGGPRYNPPTPEWVSIRNG